MTIDALLVLQHSDVDHIAQNPERFAGTKLLFIDAGLLEAARQVDLQNYQLRQVAVAPEMPALNFSQTVNTTAAIDLALTEIREELWGPGALHGWDEGLLHIPLIRAYTLRSIAKAIEHDWPEQRLGLLRPATPATSHLDSMLSTEIVAANPARWSVVGHYPTVHHWNPAMLEVCFDFAGIRRHVEAGDAECITHIPTCLYDAEAFEAAVSKTFARNIDLPSLKWDVPVRRGAGFLLQQLQDVAIDTACHLYRERARQVFTDHLAALVPSRAALAQQADAFASRSHLQAVNFVGLRRALQGSQPHFVLSDHDAGNNGPLFSVAAELRSEITVLPHSAYSTSLMPHGQRVTVIELNGAGVPIRTVLGLPVRTRGVRFRDCPAPQARQSPRRVCLLLNSMHSAGLTYIDFFALIKFFKALDALCVRTEWALSVRLKPSSPALSVVSSAFGKPYDYLFRTMSLPIDEVARDADICIAFGEPTSATGAFLNAGCYMVHVSDQEWPADYRYTTPLAALMPTQRCADALVTLERLMGMACFIRRSSGCRRRNMQRVAAWSTTPSSRSPSLPRPAPSRHPPRPHVERQKHSRDRRHRLLRQGVRAHRARPVSEGQAAGRLLAR